ncbi:MULTISPECIES: hypothetical protein [unclassified Bradyrhizobium]|uniref:hypothetical protein n=1 Tax=unclassified Bradyrhizobium TaxID=2631580 RepID=UPI001FFA9A16|nr:MULTISPECIES: hypothetical protein [unclassified Bradyrhizobium]
MDDLGARAGCGRRETDEEHTEFGTIIRDPLLGQYAYPVRIVAFSRIEGWPRDATSEVADELAERAAAAEITPALRAFIEANATKPFAVQLALPLPGAA